LGISAPAKQKVIPVGIILKYFLALDAPGDYMVKGTGASILDLRGIQFGYND